MAFNETEMKMKIKFSFLSNHSPKNKKREMKHSKKYKWNLTKIAIRSKSLSPW